MEDNGNFSAIQPTWELAPFETGELQLQYKATSVGAATGTVKINTTGGNLDVNCNIDIQAVPDYNQIVKSGDFEFHGDNRYPFLIEDGVAYNCTSKVEDTEEKTSQMTAKFTVPEGYYGQLRWEGTNSSGFADELGWGDGGIIQIDDVTKHYHGESQADAMTFAPNQVNLEAGEHFVIFGYGQGGDSKFQGDDCIRISNLSLELVELPDEEVAIWGNQSVSFKETQLSKCTEINTSLANMGDIELQVKNITATGPFFGIADKNTIYETFAQIPVTLYFLPTEAGTFTGIVTVETNVGSVTFNCQGSAVAKDGVILVEDFEDSILHWDIQDNDMDGSTWKVTKDADNPYAHEGEGVAFVSVRTPLEKNNDVLLSPEIQIPAEGATLTYWMSQMWANYPVQLSVLAGTGDDLSTYQNVGNAEMTDYNFEQQTVSLGAFAGQKIRLAFHSNMAPIVDSIFIDDILVTAGSSSESVEGLVGSGIDHIEIYDLQGNRLAAPAFGVNIVKTVYANGRIVTTKVVY